MSSAFSCTLMVSGWQSSCGLLAEPTDTAGRQVGKMEEGRRKEGRKEEGRKGETEREVREGASSDILHFIPSYTRTWKCVHVHVHTLKVQNHTHICG